MLFKLFQSYKIKSVVIMTRHGHRNSFIRFKQQFDELQITEIGVRQLNLLSQWFIKQYPDLLDKTYKEEELEITVSGQPRTQISAQSFLYGLYQNREQKIQLQNEDFVMPKWQNAKNDIDWSEWTLPNDFHPIHYDSFLSAENYLVKPTEYKPCAGLYRHKLRNEEKFQQVLKMVNEILRPKLDQSGFDYSPYKTSKTYDQDFSFNTLDQCVSQIFKGNKSIQHLQDLCEDLIQLLFQTTYFNDQNVNKFYNSFNLQKIRDFLDRQINKSQLTSSKILLMSLHENNITAILNLLGYQDFDKIAQRIWGEKIDGQKVFGNPSFASSLIFELLEKDNQYFVWIKYNNQVIRFKGQSEDIMSYQDFINYLPQITLQGNIQDIFSEYCFVENYKENKLKKILIILNAISLLLIISSTVFLLTKNFDQIKSTIQKFKNKSQENQESLINNNQNL